MDVERLTYSVEEAAEAVGISRPKAYDLIHSEGFPVVRVGRRIRIPIDGLRRWLEEQSRAV